MAIKVDVSLKNSEKARRRHELLSGKAGSDGRRGDHDGTKSKKGKHKVAVDSDEKELSDIFGGSLNCSFSMQLPERAVIVSTKQADFEFFLFFSLFIF